jgi:pilus assembly protein CpaE
MDPGQSRATDALNSLPVMRNWQFHLLAGSPDPQSAIKLQSNRIESVVRSMKASYEFVLVDIGRALSRISLPLIKIADVIVLVTSNDSNTVALTKIVWDYLRQQGVTSNHMYTILNRAVGLEGLTKPQVEERLQLRILTAMPYMGENLVLANEQHIPIAIKHPTHTATMILQEAAKLIVSQAQKIREFSG